MHTNYLIIGASHAGLSALDAIRRRDPESSLTLVTSEKEHLYSPTVLPYIISGKAKPEKYDIRPSEYFFNLGVNLIKGATATQVDTSVNHVMFNDGLTIGYKKLLIATGAMASVPKINGIEDIDFITVRTLADARNIKDRIFTASSAIVIGAGFIGMNIAENLANSGLKVTVAESLHRILGSSFDSEASDKIQQIFSDKGIRFLTGIKISKVFRKENKTVILLTDGREIIGDMLVVATGIIPRTKFLADSGIECDYGIVVDKRMRTSIKNVWGAGDAAKAPSFFSIEKSVGGTILSATEQGKIAGIDMANGNDVDDEYLGNLNMNTFGFFNNFAFSIGNMMVDRSADSGFKAYTHHDLHGNNFRKFIFNNNVLTGVSAINTRLDPGILKKLILQKVDFSKRKEGFLEKPFETSRQLMRELF